MNQLNRIETEFNIARNIYNELAINKEKTAIDVKKNTPIFTIINPVVIPNEKDSPSRVSNIILSTIFGFILASIFVFIKDYYKKIYK